MADAPVMFAPGWPGIPARWTSSAKSGLGTAVSRDSRVWFTLSHGILNEVYYPRVDHACTRDLGFIVTDGETYFSEEKRDARSETSHGGPRHSGVSDSQHGCRRSISHRERGADRPVARRRAPTRSFRAASGARWLIFACTCCWPRTSPTEAAATRRGSATTRARRCCSPSARTTRSRSRLRRRGSPDRSGSSGSRMDGSNCRPTNACARPTRAQRTATWPSPAKSISRHRMARS